MFNRCPKCQKKIAGYAVHCRACGWSLDQQVTEEPTSNPSVACPHRRVGENFSSGNAIGKRCGCDRREDYPAALSALNSAIIDADKAQLAECYATRGYSRC